MKKITLFLLVLATIFVSCQDKNAYTIDGSFANDKFDGKVIYLQRIDSIRAQAPTVLDSAIIKKDKFSFKGVAGEDVTLGFVSIGKLGALEENTPVGTVILESGKISLSFQENGDVALSGTPMNNEYNKVLIAMNNIAAIYKEVSDAGGPQAVPLDSAGNDINARMEKLQDEMQSASFGFAKANMTNKAGQFIFFTNASSFTRDQLKELVAVSDSVFLKTPEMVVLQEELNRVIPEIGSPYADVQLVDASGAIVKLSSYAGVNKCVLIDFWASWCKPCLEEIPNLKSLYASYKAKGFEIVSISEDDDKNAWLDAVKKYGMNWAQLADDQKLAGEIYALTVIPHTVLLDGNGIIVGKDLRGKELEDKIAEILK
ncbi:MAG: redoxin domain-containing protein [Dysgonomonas sp.]